MEKNRLEAFSDGVIAIIITIMVLELKPPEHENGLEYLKELLPIFLSYVLSFIYVAIYWNNHHHLLQSTQHVTGGILWANMHLLFWLSLFPFITAWVGANHFHSTPTAVYGAVLLLAGVAYDILERAIIRQQGKKSRLAAAVGKRWKESISIFGYAAAIPLAFWHAWISNTIYFLVALLWLVPDRRIERALAEREQE